VFHQNSNVITSIAGFDAFWKEESEKTKRIFEALTDESLAQKVTSDGRSLGFLAWHIVTTIGEMFESAGMKVNAASYKSPAPTKVSDFIAALEQAVQAVSETLPKNWRDENLSDKIPMYGEDWSKSFMLLALVMHQAHHRGQITVLMRQAGLKVPGLYGPAKEEWEAMGMTAMP
jgi:uncharacterized damage-inducible protein DinB